MDDGGGVGLGRDNIQRRKATLTRGPDVSAAEGGTDSGLRVSGPWAPSEVGLEGFPGALSYIFFVLIPFLYLFSDLFKILCKLDLNQFKQISKLF
jgi:hypothetical protein